MKFTMSGRKPNQRLKKESGPLNPQWMRAAPERARLLWTLKFEGALAVSTRERPASWAGPAEFSSRLAPVRD